MKQIFLKGILENTIKGHCYKHRTTSKMTCVTIMLSIVSILLVLFSVDVIFYDTELGIIQFVKERKTLFHKSESKLVVTRENNNTIVTYEDLPIILNSDLINRKMVLIEE